MNIYINLKSQNIFIAEKEGKLLYRIVTLNPVRVYNCFNIMIIPAEKYKK